MLQGRATGSSSPGDSVRRPSPVNTLFELRFPIEAALLWLHAFNHPWPRVAEASRKLVMFIPGFMAGDATLIPLASFCRYLGHGSVFGGIVSNSNCPRQTLDSLASTLERAHSANGARVVIIGQSLGGVYARELAARFPDRV